MNKERIRESHPGGESSQEEAGNLCKLELQLIKRLPSVCVQESVQHAAADCPVTTVPFSKKTEYFADIGVFFLC